MTDITTEMIDAYVDTTTALGGGMRDAAVRAGLTKVEQMWRARTPDLDAAVVAGRFAQRAHVFADTTTCVCGYEPETGEDWQRHQLEVALRAATEVTR